MASLTSYQDALDAVIRRTGRNVEVETLECLDGASLLGRVLAEDIAADDDYPRFDNSAVDGYALACEQDAVVGACLKLEGAAVAGGAALASIASGQAARILTGARTPPDTYAIVMQEDVSVEAGFVNLKASPVRGEHIRRRGADLGSGEVVLFAGTRIHPGNVGVLALSGANAAQVFRRPTVAIMSTGDELVRFRDKPTGAKIRDTNGPMLQALVRAAGGLEVLWKPIPDSYDVLAEAILEASAAANLILIAGGASVGDRDYVPKAMGALGEIWFHGVNMRPGKPLLFGKVGATPVFGLPGNPASAFVGFKILVEPALRRLGGESRAHPRWVMARYDAKHIPHGREEFSRVTLEWRDGVLVARPVGEQGSFGLMSIATAHGIARLSASAPVEPGYLCPVLPLNELN